MWNCAFPHTHSLHELRLSHGIKALLQEPHIKTHPKMGTIVFFIHVINNFKLICTSYCLFQVSLVIFISQCRFVWRGIVWWTNYLKSVKCYPRHQKLMSLYLVPSCYLNETDSIWFTIWCLVKWALVLLSNVIITIVSIWPDLYDLHLIQTAHCRASLYLLLNMSVWRACKEPLGFQRKG